MNTLLTWWVNFWLYPLPEFDYYAYWHQETMHSYCLPHVPGW